MSNDGFVLLGHDLPLGGYPSIVAPVGMLGGDLVTVYSRSASGSDFVKLRSDATYVQHSEEARSATASFDPRRHGLFALGRQSLLLYEYGQEREFFAELLSAGALSKADPFYRFSLAKETRRQELIADTFDACVERIAEECPMFLDRWIASARMSVPEELRQLLEQSAITVPTMPSLFQQGSQPHICAVLRQQDEFGFKEYDIVSPPRRFFAGMDLPPQPVEIGIDARRLQHVLTPGQLLTAKLAEGDNWPAATRRTLARLWAWFLVCEDPQRRLEARKVQTLAHQASLVRHVLDSDTLHRVLIADEVGLGKTVEAGLIIGELLERHPSLRVLYFAPARLVNNVHREFTKLGLHFRKWSSGEDADANLNDERIIASIHKAAYESNAERVLEAPGWDVLIVDECHHLSSYGVDASKSLRQYTLIQKLIEKRPTGRVLLLSGTPHQGNPDRFKNLLRLLRAPSEEESAISGRVIYRTKEDVRGWHNEPLFPLREVRKPKIVPLIPDYEGWLQQIYDFYVPEDVTAVGGARSARRRAAGWRCAQALQWAASSVQAGLGYLIRQALRLGWDLTSTELEAALSAIRPYRLGPPDEAGTVLFERMMKEVGRQQQVQDVDDIEESDETERWVADPDQLSALLMQGVHLLAEVADTKWEFIWDHVLSAAGEDQVVLFAQPIETVTALAHFLQRKTGHKPALIIGGQTESDREEAVRRFWAGETRYLVSSRAGSEGINLQCAHRLVHVDVPWNPMEMEQRVGRVHRFGSRMTVLVDTVVLEHTREERAYAVAYEKLRSIAHSLTTDPERFEELFARVMSLIPPTELQDIMAQAATGPLTQEDSDRISGLVETGYSNWRRFHEEFHAARVLNAPDPGQATWDDLERFVKVHVKAKPLTGFSALRFERRDKKQIESIQDTIPVLELPDGSLVCCEDVGGRPIIGPEHVQVGPAGLNVPLISAAMRAAAFPAEPTGVAHLRWSDAAPKPAGIPKETVGIVGMARMAVRRDPGASWIEHRTELHLWVVPSKGEAFEITGDELGDVVRSIQGSSVRTKIEVDPGLAGRLSSLETALVQQYRFRTEADASAGIRYAVFPICIIVVSD